MSVCACGVDHETEGRVAVNRWEHEKLTGTTLAGHPLLDFDGAGRHYGGTVCDGPCCDPPSADVLEALHERQAYALGNGRAERQVAAWRRAEPSRYRAEPADPTAILDEPYVPEWQREAQTMLDVTSFGGVSLLDEFCADCGTVHPPLLAMFDRVYVGSYAGVPDDWEEISIVSVGLDPAGGVVEIAVQFDDGPLVLMSPSALERLGVTVSVS